MVCTGPKSVATTFYPTLINGVSILFQIKNKTVRTIVKDLAYAATLVNVYERYGVDKFVNAMGLCVHPKFRGQGLGLEIMKSRFDMMKGVGLKCTLTVFSGHGTQRVAVRSGMEPMAEVPYDFYREEDGSLTYPGIDCKSLIAMVKIVQ